MTIVKSDEKGLEAAAKVLLSGGVAVIPTDTVYGLAAHPKFPEAVARLYTIKGRAEGKPIALLAADAQSTGIPNLQPSTFNLQPLTSHWPGALTIVHGGEGYRVPDHDWTRRLLARCGGLLRVTSANLSGQRAATDAEGALAEVGLSADLVVDDGISPGGQASTVVKVEEGGSLTLLREGPVKIVSRVVGAAFGAVLMLSGCQYPDAPSRLEGEDYRIMPVADYVDVIRREAMNPQGDLSPANTIFESTASYKVIYEDARYVSFQTQEYWYGGGAHGSTRVTVGTIDRKTGRLMRVADFVPAAKRAALQALLRERAIAHLGGEDHLQGEVTVTENFYLAADGLHFVYNQYEIACYADGITEIVITPREYSNEQQ